MKSSQLPLDLMTFCLKTEARLENSQNDQFSFLKEKSAHALKMYVILISPFDFVYHHHKAWEAWSAWSGRSCKRTQIKSRSDSTDPEPMTDYASQGPRGL